MERPRCETCPFWDRVPKRHAYYAHGYGWCHGAPPSVLNMEGETRWPELLDDDWCAVHPDFPAYLASLKSNPAPEA